MNIENNNAQDLQKHNSQNVKYNLIKDIEKYNCPLVCPHKTVLMSFVIAIVH